MTIKASHIVCAVAAIILVYYALVAYVLRYSLDRLVFLHTSAEQTSETYRFQVSDLNGNEITIRQYGKGMNGCVLFFPGQHGGIRRYEKSLFDPLADNEITLFAITYPGQNGAKGDGNFSNVQALVKKALVKIDRSYPIKDMVFIGRSLGSMVAVLAAEQWHPHGLVLEGTAPALSDAIYSLMKSKWYFHPAVLLPVQKIIKKDYLLTDAMSNLTSTKIAIFQGTNDSLMPLDHIKEIAKGRSDLSLFAVNGATHGETYIKALTLYTETILNMLNHQAAIENTTTHYPKGL